MADDDIEEANEELKVAASKQITAEKQNEFTFNGIKTKRRKSKRRELETARALSNKRLEDEAEDILETIN